MISEVFLVAHTRVIGIADLAGVQHPMLVDLGDCDIVCVVLLRSVAGSIFKLSRLRQRECGICRQLRAAALGSDDGHRLSEATLPESTGSYVRSAGSAWRLGWAGLIWHVLFS